MIKGGVHKSYKDHIKPFMNKGKTDNCSKSNICGVNHGYFMYCNAEKTNLEALKPDKD